MLRTGVLPLTIVLTYSIKVLNTTTANATESRKSKKNREEKLLEYF